MEYQVQMLIHKDLNTVIKLFLDREKMLLWEKGLDDIIDSQGTLFELNSEGFLVFKFEDKEMKMKVFVEELNPPESIVLIYEVKGAWNRCANHFKEVEESTLWTMDVAFRFDLENETPKIRFIEKTQAGMALFKDFVEGN
jgi:hypothetical protein